MSRPQAHQRSDYLHFVDLTTRWADNDIYGHVNNVMYYSYFDTTANTYLIEHGCLDIHDGKVIGLVVDSGCSYFAPLAFPDRLQGGLRIAQIGSSSVRYEIAIFKVGEDSAAAQGHFVHVFVDRDSRKPVAIPEAMRTALSQIIRA